MDTTKTKAHIINHTHWDREWFLTSIYTSRWISGLIDKLAQLAQANPDFHFLLDGQTLVIEDLLNIAPDYQPTVHELVKNGNLILGPYYCQPDWQLTNGEALIRNLLYGIEDVKRLGGTNHNTGWLVDTFGHISQAPQLHAMFGIEAVYVWRGVPQLAPYFNWVGSNGQELFTISLFGGYRNLYGVTHAPEIAVRRLTSEIAKLRPYYPTPDIPLFDGYDLEDSPEDPVTFFQQNASAMPPDLEVGASTPQAFARIVKERVNSLPRITGELNSGKYGATFPGTFSARTYLKIMAWDCAHMLYQVCEPLAALARMKGRPYHAPTYEAWSRTLLQNAVHDCICGVSIDQVHEKMEVTYRQVFEQAVADIQESAATILRDFAPGIYALSTNPFPYDGWHTGHDQCYHAQTHGVGVWRIDDIVPVAKPEKPVATFQWQNGAYTARLNADGSLQMGAATLGRLIVMAENGDTYSDEAGTRQAACRLTGTPVIEQESPAHCVIRYPCELVWDTASVTATVRLIFDQTPLVRWQVDLDSQGTDFRVDMVFETAHRGPIHAGMPFDVVRRATVDRDLLPRDLDPPLGEVLLGQREIGEVKTFPFHDFITVSGDASSATVFARGVHAYQADDQGRIAVTLRRSVEWLTRPGFQHRVGDAGPFFYVPDARCERHVRHELAVAIGKFTPHDLQRMNAGFQNPPLIVETRANGSRTTWPVLQENLPMSSLHVRDGNVLARFYNPTDRPVDLRKTYQATDNWGQPTGTIRTVPPKDIVTVAISQPLPPTADALAEQPIRFLARPVWRVGNNHGLPDRAIIERLKAQSAELDDQVAAIAAQLKQASGSQRYRLEHQVYVLKRESTEYRLSVRLNELKLAAQGELSETYLFELDPQVAEIGFQLNQLRIKRRIYDYIVAIL